MNGRGWRARPSTLEQLATVSQHVYARVSGFGLTLIPRAPYRLQQQDDATQAIDLEYHSPERRLCASLIPDNGGYRSTLDQHTRSLVDVVDVEPGPQLSEWRIETILYTCRWPLDYALLSNDFPRDPSPFDLIGPHHEMIFIQQPQRMPAVKDLCGPEQSVIKIHRTGRSEWIELSYEHRGESWRQRHEILTVNDRQVAVTVQSPASGYAAALVAATFVTESIEPFDQPRST